MEPHICKIRREAYDRKQKQPKHKYEGNRSLPFFATKS